MATPPALTQFSCVLQALFPSKRGSQRSKYGRAQYKHKGVVIHYPIVFLVRRGNLGRDTGKNYPLVSARRKIRAGNSNMSRHRSQASAWQTSPPPHREMPASQTLCQCGTMFCGMSQPLLPYPHPSTTRMIGNAGTGFIAFEGAFCRTLSLGSGARFLCFSRGKSTRSPKNALFY